MRGKEISLGACRICRHDTDFLDATGSNARTAPTDRQNSVLEMLDPDTSLGRADGPTKHFAGFLFLADAGDEDIPPVQFVIGSVIDIFSQWLDGGPHALAGVPEPEKKIINAANIHIAQQIPARVACGIRMVSIP